jgi:hypothetical protein
MTDNQQSSALTPIPSPAPAGEGSIVTEMVVNHFRKTQYMCWRRLPSSSGLIISGPPESLI